MKLPHAIGLLATRNRHAQAHHAAHLFFEQRYDGPKTLLIYDDSPTPFELCDALKGKDVAVVNLAPVKLPAKRNAMMRAAIAHDPDAVYFVWDDDDYNGPMRIARQVAALQTHPAAEGVIFCPYLTYDIERRTLDQLGKATLHRLPIRIFTDANLAFRRQLWERLPWDETIDPHACWRWMREPVDRIIDISGERDYVVVRHATNHTAGMLPKQFHPALRTPNVDVGWTNDDVERLLVTGCTCQPRPDRSASAGSRTGR